jgi:hypothetical protein
LNRDHLLTEAKKEVLHMVAAGYKPPAPEPIYAAGRDALAAIRIGAWMFKPKANTSRSTTITSRASWPT